MNPRVVTYLGRRARVTETRHGSSPFGLRTIRTEWLDDQVDGHPAGTITERTIRGDARRGTLEVVSEEQVIR